MSRPRLVNRAIALPLQPERYDPAHEAQRSRIILEHLATLQPAQQRQSVTGSKASGAALASLLTAMANLGFITDSTVA